MNILHTRGRRIEIPADVSEVTPEQYRVLLGIHMAGVSGYMDIAVARRWWLSHLIGIPDYTILKDGYVAEIEEQAHLIDPFFVEDDKGWRVDLSTPANVLKEVEGYHGPDDWLDGMTFGEAVECLTLVDELRRCDDNDTAVAVSERMARVMYHIPEDKEVPDLLTVHAPILFNAVWNRILSGPIDINGEMIDFGIIFKAAPGRRRPDDKTGWTGIVMEVAAAGLFGPVGQVERSDMWKVLIYLYRCKFEYNHQKNN